MAYGIRSQIEKINEITPHHHKFLRCWGRAIGSWLRGPLKEWAEELLDENRLIDDGFFTRTLYGNCGLITRQEKSWQYLLWGVLMLQALHEKKR